MSLDPEHVMRWILGKCGRVTVCPVFHKDGWATRPFRPRMELLENRCLLSGGPALPSAYGQIPLSFEVNQGQTNAQVDYLAHGQGYGIFLSKTDALLSLTNAKGGGNAIRMHLVGDNSSTAAIGLDKQSGTSNYFISNNPSQWQTHIPNYGQVGYQDVYPGIGVIYFGNQQQLEYDFHVAPDTDPNAIQLAFAGATGVEVDSQGQLLVHTSGGDITWSAPLLYQETAAGRQLVSGQFVVTGPDQVGFAVGAYNPARELVIDPTLVYSTYLGGNNGTDGAAIAVDATGHAYVTGDTAASNFPTATGAFQTSFSNNQMTFVTELNPTGTALVYSTYLGASSGAGSGGSSIAVNASGDAFVTGYTYANFPTTTGAFQATNPSGSYNSAFVTELNSTGTALVYSTYLGGDNYTQGSSIAVDAVGHAYVTGYTQVSDFPTTPGAFQTTNSSGDEDSAFLTELNSTGTGLVYSTYLGGGNNVTFGLGIAVDTAGHAYVTGQTSASNFPTTSGAFQTTYLAPAGSGSAFVTEFNPTGTGLVYSTFLGGNSGTAGRGIAVDAVGHAYVTGVTEASNFPTTGGAFQTTNLAGAGNYSAFVTELNPTGTGLVYSTYLGGNNLTVGFGIVVDSSSQAYVTGQTNGSSFPTTPGAFQTTNLAGPGNYSAFVTELNPTGTGLVYSTYLGGNTDTLGRGIALDSIGEAYLTGYTYDSNFPTTANAFQTINPAPAGDESAFVAKFEFAPVTPTFQVTSTLLLSGDNGFLMTFNVPYNIAQLDLYTGDSGGTLAARSVQITGPNDATFGGTAPDTMRFNAVPVDSTQLELILTGLNHVEAAQVLAAGSYTVTLDGGSSDPAFERLLDGAYLDGNGEGTVQAVDNYTTTVSVTAIPPSTAVVTIGDLVAGPGQTVGVPLVLSGGTSSVSGTTSVSLTVAVPVNGAYTVTAFTVNNLTIPGVSANFNPATGLLTINSATPFATNDNPLLLGTFTFAVAGLGNPGTAPGIDTKTPINITVNSVLDDSSNPKPFIGVNGFHVAAYLGNLSAPVGVYNSTDVSQLQGFIISTVKAFALYPDIDPMLLADVNKDGSINSSDVSQLQARILGLPSSIPALPLGASGVAVNGADPVLFVGTSYTPNGQPADLGSLTPGSMVLVPVSVFVTDRHGVNVTAAETAFSFDPKVFTFNGVSAGAIASGSLGGSPFVVAFAKVGPGEVNVIGSSNDGPNLAYGQTATLFLVSLTVRSDSPEGGTLFNLMSSEGGLQTGLQDNQGRNLVLAPAPLNKAGDNLDGAFTVQGELPIQTLAGSLSGTTATGVKQASSITAWGPAAWEQLTTLLFGNAANQSVLNGTNGGLAVAVTVPVTVAAEGKKEAGSVEAFQGVAWKQLTTELFGATESEFDLNGNPTTS